MEIKFIDGAPDAIGPYCHAVRTGNLVYCSGQTPLDPKTMKLSGTTIEEQTARVFENLKIVLAGCGLTLENIVKTNVYLRDMDDFSGMNGIYAEKMGDHRPARTTIAVKKNPLDAMVEIECIAEAK
ncbi:MAG: Rid family detoxifying hydrolase [Alphaproteobacteria bacterium]|nr:Rid family detoxifying hydrolase [Alphaproteobacteria bacterium]HPF45415.1 Rid family detoxifying hydrolase [Emcibacteraceae bacterium]HRW28830.1 Rid family detoxifying hydrolase [Emcibacteraceae bacterium]